jgi:hypothetical protein
LSIDIPVYDVAGTSIRKLLLASTVGGYPIDRRGDRRRRRHFFQKAFARLEGLAQKSSIVAIPSAGYATRRSGYMKVAWSSLARSARCRRPTS